MYTNLVVISVAQLTIGTVLKSGKVVEPDTNGKAPYIYNIIAGRAPNRTIQSGTVVENSKMEAGKSYLCQVRETEASKEYGRQFTWVKVSELSGLDIVETCQKIGLAEVFEVEVVNAGSMSGARTIPAKASAKVGP